MTPPSPYSYHLSQVQCWITEEARMDYLIWDFAWCCVAGASAYQLYVKHLDALNPVIDATTKDSSYHFAEYGSYVIISNSYDIAWKVRAMVSGTRYRRESS